MMENKATGPSEFTSFQPSARIGKGEILAHLDENPRKDSAWPGLVHMPILCQSLWSEGCGSIINPAKNTYSALRTESVTDGVSNIVFWENKVATPLYPAIMSFYAASWLFFTYLSLRCKLLGHRPWLLYLCIPMPLAWCFIKGRTSMNGGC